MRTFFSRRSKCKRKRKNMISSCIQVLAFVSAISAPSISYADSSVTPTTGTAATSTTATGTAATSTTAISTTATVTRIIQYPTFNNFYESIHGVLYHVLGTPEQPESSFSVGTAPSFIQDGNVYVCNSNHQFYRRDPDGDHLVGSYIPKFESLDLRLRSPLNAADIDSFIAQHSPGSPLIGFGQDFIDAQTKYGVNAEYLAAHAILESDYGQSPIAEDKHNLFGYQAYDDDAYGHAAYFASFKDSIDFEAYFVRTQYLNSNGQWFSGSPTLIGMNVHYASDPLWSEKIAGIMNKMHPYDVRDYNQLSPLPVSSIKPTGPIANPVQTIINSTVPMTAVGTTIDIVNFRSSPSLDSTVYSVLAGDTNLNIIGQTGNWYKVIVGSQTGWVYKSYVKLQQSNSSTGSVPVNTQPTPTTPVTAQPVNTQPNTISTVPNAMTTDNVNFRKGPSLSSSPYSILQKGTKITVLGYQQNWYHVSDGKNIGWVFKDYIKLNLKSTGINVLINGAEQTYDQQPIIENGRTLLPLRSIFESLGAAVEWQPSTQTVTATKGQTKILLKIGSNTAYVNGRAVSLDAKAQIIHNRTMVPTRFICDALGDPISWDDTTNSVFIQA